MGKVTAKDVGRAAGVHASTVSRILNRAFHLHRYDPQTVQRVQQCAQDLGYRPSQAARSLRMGKTMQVGVVVSDIANPFFGQIVSQVERHIRGAGYRTLICNTQDDARMQAEHLADLSARHVDGIILSPSGSAGCAQVIRAGVPLVLVDRPLPRLKLPYVGLDNLLAGRMIGAHLWAMGCRRVGVATVDIPDDPTLPARLAGLREGLRGGSESADPLDPSDSSDAAEVVWTEAGLPDALAQALLGRLSPLAPGSASAPGSAPGSPFGSAPFSGRLVNRAALEIDAAVGLTNHATVALIQALGDGGLAIGRDLGLAGIDDFTAARVLRPGVTVVAQPVAQIAQEAVRMLLELMAGRPLSQLHVELSPRLIPRGSLGESASLEMTSPALPDVSPDPLEAL